MKPSIALKPSTGKKRSLALKLSLIVLTSAAGIFLAAFGVTYFTVREMMLEHAETQAREMADATANRIFANLNGVMATAHPLSAMTEDGRYDVEALHDMLDQVVQRSPQVSGAAIAFEPYSVNPDQRYFAPFSYQKNGEIRRAFLGGEGFDYFVRDWYQVPRETGRPVWTDPFLAEGGADEMIATYAAPLYRQEGDTSSFIGVLALDISLAEMVERIGSVSIFDSGFAFLVSSTGAFVTYPDPDFITRESFFSLADQWDLPKLREIGRAMVRGEEGFVQVPARLIGEPAWMYYAPLPAVDWTLAVIAPDRELFADVLQLTKLVLAIAGVGFLALLIAIVGVTRSITMPLKRLVRTASEIARGNLDEALPPVHSGDEVGELAKSFDEMRLSLRDYIDNLTATTKAKERIESELLIARNIQQSFLPKQRSLPRNVTEFDLHADLHSAKHVGGDLYDFFLLQDRFLFFAVGDVSDKGVPAALFMAVTKTLVKGIAEQYESPGAILERVNNELCVNNDNGMFVTYVCGVLDLRTGALRLANAGHNLPLIRRAGKNAEWLDLAPALVLGAIEEIEYPVREITLHPGDSLMFYTDGVVEAIDSNGSLFGDEPLRQLFDSREAETPPEMVKKVFDAVNEHSRGEPQSDDITVLVLDFVGVTEPANFAASARGS